MFLFLTCIACASKDTLKIFYLTHVDESKNRFNESMKDIDNFFVSCCITNTPDVVPKPIIEERIAKCSTKKDFKDVTADIRSNLIAIGGSFLKNFQTTHPRRLKDTSLIREFNALIRKNLEVTLDRCTQIFDKYKAKEITERDCTRLIEKELQRAGKCDINAEQTKNEHTNSKKSSYKKANGRKFACPYKKSCTRGNTLAQQSDIDFNEKYNDLQQTDQKCKDMVESTEKQLENDKLPQYTAQKAPNKKLRTLKDCLIEMNSNIWQNIFLINLMVKFLLPIDGTAEIRTIGKSIVYKYYESNLRNFLAANPTFSRQNREYKSYVLKSSCSYDVEPLKNAILEIQNEIVKSKSYNFLIVYVISDAVPMIQKLENNPKTIDTRLLSGELDPTSDFVKNFQKIVNEYRGNALVLNKVNFTKLNEVCKNKREELLSNKSIATESSLVNLYIVINTYTHNYFRILFGKEIFTCSNPSDIARPRLDSINPLER